MADLKKRNRRLAVVLILAGLVIASLFFWRVTNHAPGPVAESGRAPISGTALQKPSPIQSFRLTNGDGVAFTNKDLLGHWSFLFFGFTGCPYVCPTTLAQLNIMENNLQKKLPQRLWPQIVMVSVDPQRDTAERMKEYVTGFNPHFIGLRSSMENTLKFAKAMNVSFAKVHPDGAADDQYTVTHTATIMVVGPKGRLRAYLSYPHEAETMERDYLTLMHWFHAL